MKDVRLEAADAAVLLEKTMRYLRRHKSALATDLRAEIREFQDYYDHHTMGDFAFGDRYGIQALAGCGTGSLRTRLNHEQKTKPK